MAPGMHPERSPGGTGHAWIPPVVHLGRGEPPEIHQTALQEPEHAFPVPAVEALEPMGQGDLWVLGLEQPGVLVPAGRDGLCERET